jgi:tRNA(Ile)-lysidine synthase
MALVVLAHRWAGGRVVGLVVDHGLREESAAEAAGTVERLRGLGIPARLLTLAGLAPGQAAARAARHAALAAAARAAGALFLLVGHQAEDQAETVAMRAARGAHGLEGMAAWTAREDVVLVRPLLCVSGAVLRDFLRAEGVGWVEDPSNADLRFERVRVRVSGGGMEAVGAAGRVAWEVEVAAFVARHVVLRPEGFAVIAAEVMPARALGALIRAVAGRDFAPPLAATAALAGQLRAASLGGTLLARTRGFGGGWLLAREPADCAPPLPAVAGAVWDGRFRLHRTVPDGVLGALGEDAGRYRKNFDLPSVVLRGLPCVRTGGGEILFPVPGGAWFRPPAPVAAHPFLK